MLMLIITIVSIGVDGKRESSTCIYIYIYIWLFNLASILNNYISYWEKSIILAWFYEMLTFSPRSGTYSSGFSSVS